MSDDEQVEVEMPETGLHVITIVYSDDTAQPEVNLGDCNPWLAYSIFSTILESISVLLLPPKITYEDRTIFDVVLKDDDDD